MYPTTPIWPPQSQSTFSMILCRRLTDAQTQEKRRGYLVLLYTNWWGQALTFNQPCGKGGPGQEGGLNFNPSSSYVCSWLLLIFHRTLIERGHCTGWGMLGLRDCNYPNYTAVSVGSNAQDWPSSCLSKTHPDMSQALSPQIWSATHLLVGVCLIHCVMPKNQYYTTLLENISQF